MKLWQRQLHTYAGANNERDCKFYSTLRHLVILLMPSITKCAIAFQAHDDKTDKNALVAGVMKLTECPPLATALHHILTFQTFSHLSYLVSIGSFKNYIGYYL